MDVRCNRCATEYEFDDALISERGTTVKCTNCGFQFKIFPPKSSQVAPERWVVSTADGRELTFTSLRELQRGISDRRVGPNDLLSRGASKARPLGSIPELEPFFSATSARAPVKAPRTLHGVAPPPGPGGPASGGPVGAPPPSSVESRAPAPSATPKGPPLKPSPATPQVAARVEANPLSGTLPAATDFFPRSPEPSPLAPSHQGADTRRDAPPTGAGTPPSEPAPLSRTLQTAAPPSSSLRAEQSFPAPTTTASPRLEDYAVPSSQRRESLASYDEIELGSAGDDRRARSRWIAAVVILGVIGLFAATVGRQYLTRLTTKPAPPGVVAEDGRVKRLLAEGTRLLEEGDLEAAKEQFVKAQALADKNPAVLSALARLETMRADIAWLRLRLLDPEATELVQSTHRDLGRRVGKAREAAEAAFRLDPEAPAVVRARVDAFRLSGESAREWAAPLAAKADDPQNAYVLAALDMAEQNPDWAKLVERFKLAARSGEERVRGRAALVYALARAGLPSEAEKEVQAIEADKHQHPLLDELKGFVVRFGKTASDAGPGDAGSAVATVDVSKLPALDTSNRAEAEPREPKGDFRKRLVDAANALRGGDLGRAEQLYQSVLNEQPGNTEALSGLADVAKRRNDHGKASRLYQQVLEQNPSYLPALMATADSRWAAGDRKGALVLYRRVLDQAGAGSEYGQRAAARIAEAGPAKEAEAPAPAAPAPAPGAPGAPAPEGAPEKPAAPEIDTTDLPGNP